MFFGAAINKFIIKLPPSFDGFNVIGVGRHVGTGSVDSGTTDRKQSSSQRSFLFSYGWEGIEYCRAVTL